MILHQTSGRWRLGLSLSLTAAFLWGILPISLSVVLEVLDVYTVTWFRFGMAFCSLFIYLASRKQLPELQKLRKASLGLIITATLFLGLNYLLFLQGLLLTSPTTAEVVIQLAPLLFSMGALVIFKERYSLPQWLGLGVLSLGFALYFHEQLKPVVTAPNNYLLGNALLVVGAAFWAIYALAQKQLLHKLPSTTIMLVIYGGCGLLFTPLAQPQLLLNLSPLHWGMLLFCGLNTLLAYGAFAEALDHWEASRVSAITALTPLVTLVSVWAVSVLTPTLIAPEYLSLLGILGALLVVAGSVVIAIGKNKSKLA
jgi:drug/metabolite transporter (DMT)-like permease